ncbi:MAG: helix-turn-helix domain-containing protein [Candidatus Nanohaloarchaea archaeon]|nr:helix-turn-helix domain-containing protein [Candidatus Nanohaloarchaea archaeon]
MWVVKIKFDGENALRGSRAKKHNVSVTGYPVASYERNNSLYVNAAISIFGEEENKERFVADLRNAERTMGLENNGDFMLLHHRAVENSRKLYNPRFVYVEPMIIDEDATELWTVGCWERSDLEDYVEAMQDRFDADLLKLRQENTKGVSVARVQPDLTDRQRKAMKMAVRHGYYSQPRATDLKELAGIMGVSYSTFQSHLRKAEERTIPFYFDRERATIS